MSFSKSDINKILAKIEEAGPAQKRIIIAIAGAPGSGKSTLAEQLATMLNEKCVIVPMDGFHLSNQHLKSVGLLDRKGSPPTFDAEGFVDLIKLLHAHKSDLSAPGFDRANDCVIPAAQSIPKAAKVILAEGNYLLLKEEPWSQLRQYFDLTVFIQPSQAILRERLVKRWLDNGLNHPAAVLRVEQNDLANARTVIECSSTADFAVGTGL